MILKSILWNQDQNADRPEGASTKKCGDKYGNPSGHSQFVWFFSVFWILYILNSKFFDNKVANTLSCSSLILIAIVSWSRVLINCHNFAQVLTGSIIGIILGTLAFYLTKNNLLRK